MASAFGHAAIALGISAWNRPLFRSARFWFFMAASAVLPDIDAIGYKLGVPYGSMWGHRGFTHSVLFAVIWAGLIAFFFFRSQLKSSWGFLFLATISHGLADACSTGGLGVGFFIPWDNTRYFFPFHPIAVSPIGVNGFFTERGLRVLRSEMLWIGVPAAAMFLSGFWRQRAHPRRT